MYTYSYLHDLQAPQKGEISCSVQTVHLHLLTSE